MQGDAYNCRGSDKRPSKVTPFSSKKAAFSVKTEPAWCEGCSRFVETTRWGGLQMFVHHYPNRYVASRCRNSFSEVPANR